MKSESREKKKTDSLMFCEKLAESLTELESDIEDGLTHLEEELDDAVASIKRDIDVLWAVVRALNRAIDSLTPKRREKK
jgi:prefoldin subunit 5